MFPAVSSFLPPAIAAATEEDEGDDQTGDSAYGTGSGGVLFLPGTDIHSPVYESEGHMECLSIQFYYLCSHICIGQ